MTALLILDVDPQVDPPPPRVDFHVGPFPVMKRPHVAAPSVRRIEKRGW